MTGSKLMVTKRVSLLFDLQMIGHYPRIALVRDVLILVFLGEKNERRGKTNR